MPLIKDCTDCPLYMKTTEAREATGQPYFGMCGGTGRFINARAQRVLPASSFCPLPREMSPDLGAAVYPSVATAEAFADTHPENPVVQPFVSTTAHDDVRPYLPAHRVAAPLSAGAVGTHQVRTGTAGITTAADSCKRCIFFQPKANGISGTPSARYDMCQRYGTLIKPGSRAAVAAECTGSIKGTPTPVASGSRTLLPIYAIAAAPVAPKADPGPTPWDGVPAPAEPVDDRTFPIPTSPLEERRAASERPATPAEEAPVPTVTVDPITAPSSLDLEAIAARAAAVARAGADIERRAEEPEVLPLDAPGDKRKDLPVRANKTGLVCLAEAYKMPYALPEGADGVVAVRATSRAAFVWLPHYAEDAFDERTRAHVPAPSETAYFDHTDLLYRMAVAYATNSVCALWGDAGVGKTEAVEHLARLTRQPFTRISIKWATQVDDLIGRYTLHAGDMVWIDGRFTKAWRQPYLICVDEPNTGKDEVWQALRAPFDGAQTLVLDEKDGEEIPRHPLCRVFTAMNPGWDARFMGTRPLNDADVDRMQHIMVPYAPREVEEKIIKAKAPATISANEATVKGVLDAARDIRAAVQAKSIRVSFGLRKVLRWCAAMEYLSPLQAFEQSVTAWMEPNEARQLRDIADAYFKN